MERAREKEIREIEFEIHIWRENQVKHTYDEAFFHYSQRLIDQLEDRLDKISRLENWNEYLSI